MGLRKVRVAPELLASILASGCDAVVAERTVRKLEVLDVMMVHDITLGRFHKQVLLLVKSPDFDGSDVRGDNDWSAPEWSPTFRKPLTSDQRYRQRQDHRAFRMIATDSSYGVALNRAAKKLVQSRPRPVLAKRRTINTDVRFIIVRERGLRT